MPGKPTVYPTKVDVKTIEPRPRFTMAGIWCLAARKALVRLVATVSCQPASGTSGVGPMAPNVPALLKATSSPPKRVSARSTSARA